MAVYGINLFMVDFVKVAKIVKRIREYQSKATPVPSLQEVRGVPTASSNDDATDPADPTAHNTPSDIGPENAQTISGTGSGPALGDAPGVID